MPGYCVRDSRETQGSAFKCPFKTFDDFDSTSSAVNGNFEWFFYIRSFSSECSVRFPLGHGLLEFEGRFYVQGTRLVTDDQ
jgi:hypothetical protein